MTRAEIEREMKRRRPYWLPGEEALTDARVGKDSWYAMKADGDFAGLRIYFEGATGQAVLRDFLRPSTIYQRTEDIVVLRHLLDATLLNEQDRKEKP